MTTLQKQAIEAANESNKVGQTLVDAIRDATVLTTHTTAAGLDQALVNTLAELKDFKEFMAGSKTGDVPAGTVVNPKLQPEFVPQRKALVEEDGSPKLVDGVQQYDIIQVYNNAYNGDKIPSHIFQPTTGLEVSEDGVLNSTDVSLETLALRLAFAAALETFKNTDVDLGDGVTIKAGILAEQVVTV